MGGPHEAHGAGCDTGHAEAKEGAAGEKFVALTLIELQDCHVCNGAEDVEEEEDTGDGNIGSVVGEAAETRGCGSVWGAGGLHLRLWGGLVRIFEAGY
jgi:hypothetical protein